MNFNFKKRFFILMLIVVLVTEYFLIASIYSLYDNDEMLKSKTDSGECDTKNQLKKRRTEPFDAIHSRLGENYVEDFLKYKCLSSIRFGGSNNDPNYRVEGR